jgi:predicted nuclease of predicted toxin-antitoxin system
VNFLIDECLHTSLVEVAVLRGHEATHVTYRGWGGWQDWNLMPEILEGGFTFVTNNAKDFRRLYAQADIHDGLVILIPNAPPAIQRELFAAVLDALDETPGLINEALEAEVVDGEVEITRYELPPEPQGYPLGPA